MRGSCCAGQAFEVQPNLIVRPTTVAVDVPEPRAPLGAGISWLTVRNAVSFVVAAWRVGVAGEATATSL